MAAAKYDTRPLAPGLPLPVPYVIGIPLAATLPLTNYQYL
jgi:hypothetical protein